MNLYKKRILVFLSLILTMTGCQSRTKPISTVEKAQTEDTQPLPEFKYSDDCFNSRFSKDEEGNIYFHAGRYLYRLDKNMKLTKLRDLVSEDEYMIMRTAYYKNRIYFTSYIFDRSSGIISGLASIDTDGKDFQYIRDVEYPIPEYMFISDDKIYLGNDHPQNLDTDCLRIYPLDNPQNDYQKEENKFSERNKLILERYPDCPLSAVSHIYKNKLYQKMGGQGNADDEYTILEYDTLENKTTEYKITLSTKEPVVFDLIDDHWFVISDDNGVERYSIDFSQKDTILSAEQIKERYAFVSLQKGDKTGVELITEDED